jgi:hypothetical protein
MAADASEQRMGQIRPSAAEANVIDANWVRTLNKKEENSRRGGRRLFGE